MPIPSTTTYDMHYCTISRCTSAMQPDLRLVSVGKRGDGTNVCACSVCNVDCDIVVEVHNSGEATGLQTVVVIKYSGA